jgi:PAS domain-containing protein
MGVSEPLIQSSLLGEAAENAPFAILVSDEDGRYVAVNRADCNLLGYTREELLTCGRDDIAPAGGSSLTCKDGSIVAVTCVEGTATVAGMPVTVSVSAAAS